MILVTGGSGNVGARVVQALLDQQQAVRVMTRGSNDWHDNPLPHFRRSGADIITGDVRDANKVKAAVQGVKGIIHLSAIMRGSDADIESVNADGVRNVLDAAKAAGVQRFVHVSCLGATEFSTSKYFASKWQGEKMVRESGFFWTIFRPSLIFGATSHMMRALDFCVAKLPFVPVFGSGLNVIQPVSPDDVAACVFQSLYNRDTVSKTYDLVGPSALNLTELLEYMAQRNMHGSTSRPTVKVPLQAAFIAAQLIAKFNPRAPISEDMFRVLTTELVGDEDQMKNAFQVDCIPFEAQFKRLTKR
jgi:NADH dehydrogenase